MKNYEYWLDACNKESRLLGRELYLDNDETFKRFIEIPNEKYLRKRDLEADD